MSGQSAIPNSAWIILSIAVIAVSSGGIVLQEMSQVEPLLRASWRMQGTALVLLPGFAYQCIRANGLSLSRNDFFLVAVSSLFLAMHFGSWVWSLDNTNLVHNLLFVNASIGTGRSNADNGTSGRKGICRRRLGVTGAILALKDVGDGRQVTWWGLRCLHRGSHCGRLHPIRKTPEVKEGDANIRLCLPGFTGSWNMAFRRVNHHGRILILIIPLKVLS